MKLRIVALGQKMPTWLVAGFDEYARRMPREYAVELVELKPAPRGSGKSPAQILAAEAELLAEATRGAMVIALDEHGVAWTTAQFAARLRTWRNSGRPIAFVLGSADGLAAVVKHNADVIMTLSALTLPHGLARVVLIEQLYRAASLLQGHPYHRE
jgi:23S rRNA (pseudouridine1915-N3)-methyltransferase